jgi:succinate-semialdehyde dehydrogenase/glutarate-semialdehyde dehydrogenase
VLVSSEAVKPLIEDDNIAAVTLTGSVGAGPQRGFRRGRGAEEVRARAGRVGRLSGAGGRRGGAAAKVCADRAMVNGGQSCIAGKRFIVVREIRERFEQALVEAMRAYAMGDPREASARLGPMQSVKARDEIHAQVQASLEAGARLLLGGEVPDRPGAWYPRHRAGRRAPGAARARRGGVRTVAGDHRGAGRGRGDPHRQPQRIRPGLGRAHRGLDRGRRIAAEALEAGMSFVNENVRSDRACRSAGSSTRAMAASVLTLESASSPT